MDSDRSPKFTKKSVIDLNRQQYTEKTMVTDDIICPYYTFLYNNYKDKIHRWYNFDKQSKIQRIGMDHSKCRDLFGSIYDPTNTPSKTPKWDNFNVEEDLQESDLLLIIGDYDKEF